MTGRRRAARCGIPKPKQRRLGLDLVQAAPEKQGGVLDQLKEGKGAPYTDALAGAIAQLSGSARTRRGKRWPSGLPG